MAFFEELLVQVIQILSRHIFSQSIVFLLFLSLSFLSFLLFFTHSSS